MATKGVTELEPFERCRSCTAELSPGREVCPACGTPVPRSSRNTPPKPRWSTGRKISHAIIFALLVLVANMYRPFVEPYLRAMWPPWLAPYVGEAMSRVEANKAAMELLGEPVEHSRYVRGELRKYGFDSGAAKFRVAVSGSKSKGSLQAELGQVDGVWAFSELRLTLDGTGNVVDLLDGLEQPARAAMTTERTLYLVPLGDVNQDALGLKELPDFYRKKFNLEVKLLAPLAIEERARDREREQLLSEELINLMLRRLPHLARDPKAAIIGVTREGMYYPERGWSNFPTFWEGNKAGIVSSVRLAEDAGSDIAKKRVKARIRKAISRVTGMIVYELPRSEDPTSVMAKVFFGPHNADLMSDEFDGLGSLAVIDSFTRSHWLPAFTPTVTPSATNVDAARVDISYPCILAKRDRSAGAPAASWQAQVTKCLPQTFTDLEADELEIDLRSGALMTRETDLFVDGAIPLASTRCFRSWDNRIRTFGYNRGMSWDIYPTGSRNPYTFMNVNLCDGQAIYFERVSEGTGYANALYEHKASATPFLGARFGWTGSGWELARADGAHMYFPESYNAKRAVDGGLVAFTGAKGEVVTLQRGPLRNLRQISIAGGAELRFDYDAQNRVSKSRDSRGRTAEYIYDMAGRLAAAKTTYGDRRYTYSGTYLESVRENGQSLFQIRYHRGRVSDLILANGQSYKLRYDLDARDNYTPVQTHLTGPDGKTEKFAMPPKK